MRTLKNQKGLSLIEVTIMLLVLMLLTGVLAPSIFDFVKDAQWVKVKEDCEAISLSIARLHRDVGCIEHTYGLNNCKFLGQGGTIPGLLMSDGPTVEATQVAGAATVGFSDALLPGGTGASTWNWTDAIVGRIGTQIDSLTNQLVTNAPGYPEPPAGPASPFGPWFNKGWRGAYLSSPIGPDPYSTPYLVNSVLLNVPQNAVAPGVIGHNYDTFCISAGPNRVFETPFGQTGARPYGDDFITMISGGTF